MSEEEAFFGRQRKGRIHKQTRKFSFVFYQVFYGPIAFIKAVYRQVLILALMFVLGAVIYSYYDHLPTVNAFLASVSTITTVGFFVPNGGNFFTLNQDQAVLLIVLIIISVGALASIVQSMVSMLVDGKLAKSEAQKQLMKRLKNHVIVFGYSHLGKYISEKLEELGFDYVIMTKDPNTYAELLKRDIFVVLEYKNALIEALKTAGIDQASMVVIAHEQDSENMLITLTTRKLRQDVRIISVVHDPTLVETAKAAGASKVIPDTVTIGQLVALSAVTKGLVGVVFSEKVGAKEIAEFSIFKGSPLIGKGLKEISKYGSVIGVIRDGKVETNLFFPDFTLKENDTLLVMGETEMFYKIEKKANVPYIHRPFHKKKEPT
jgi:voltage-gated potassium channel